MKRITAYFIILFFVCGHAFANVSRIYTDHSFSGNIKPIKPAGQLKLFREDIKVIFPIIGADNASLEKKIDMHISYIIENRSDSAMEIPLQFLGIDVSNPLILLNEKSLTYGLVKDLQTEREFLGRITEHRHQWNKPQYEQYFMYLDYVNSGKKTIRSASLIHMTLPEFIKTAQSVENLSDIFPGMGKLNIIHFNVKLLPGKNNLTIKYGQGMYVEGRTSYVGGPVFRCGFEYLLYPAFTWEMHPDFELSVSVSLPDFIKNGWLWDSRVTPIYESNLTFYKTYNPETHTTTYRSLNRSFPSSVFAFIVRKDVKEEPSR
jgi:hypothetical protein